MIFIVNYTQRLNKGVIIVKSILIVEDEANISDFIKLELEYEGYNVCVKSDGREGLQEALSGNYHLIILKVLELDFLNHFHLS